MSDKRFKGVEYTRVDLDSSPSKEANDTALGEPSSSDAEDQPKDSANEQEPTKGPSVWQFEYYQQFFAVDSRQVGHRMFASMLPRPGSATFLEEHVRPNPDLYGPFWICTTLVFTIAIAGNLYNFFQTPGENKWQYDFQKVTFAASAIYMYWWLVPLAVFGFLWWRGSSMALTFTECLCVYGYSLAIYIPTSLLWVIPYHWVQWMLVLLAASLSGSVLAITFWPAVRSDERRWAAALMIFIILMHALLATGFMTYFFHVPPNVTSSKVASTTTTVKPITATPLITEPPRQRRFVRSIHEVVGEGPGLFRSS